MSILTGFEIHNEVALGNISICPYDIKQLNPNSYDVKLGDELITYILEEGECLEFRKRNKTKRITIPEEGYILQPGKLYLGTTVEVTGTDKYVPMIEGKSSSARLGINIHVSAGFGDVGFMGKWTLELTAVHPVRVNAGDCIAQVYFKTLNLEKLRLAKEQGFPVIEYNGKYKNQYSAVESRSYLDFV